MQNGGTTDNRQIRTVCEQNGINLDEHITKVKEAVEIGLMHVARSIAQSDKPLRQKYDELIDLYNRQPYVGTKKTLKQMVLQQYSTPLPIAFLMSEFVKNKSNSSLYFEPSAGNGFLTISLPQENTICNEIDRYRLENLKNEHYRKVSEQDARQPFEYNRIFDGVVTNPPFLKGQETNTMIFNALETMKDNGRCAILRDGNAQFTEYAGTKLRSSFTGFYDKLFQEYNVVKIINLNAKKIYAKQGTSFFMHIILINGRRANKLSDDDSMHRVYNPEIDKIDLAGFEELWEYFLPYIIDETSYYYYSLANKSKLLFKELELTIEVGDEFVKEKQLSWKQKSKIDYWLRSKEIKDKEIFDFYYVSHINKNGDIHLFNEQNDITQIYTRKEFYELGLQFYKHYKPKGLGSIDGSTYIIEYGDDIKAFIDGRFVLSCERNGYVNPYFTIKYSNEAERLHRFRNYCEHVFKHTFEVKGGDSYVSPLLIKELGLLIKKNDVFIEPLKGAKEKNSLTQKEADQLKYYIVTDIYGVGDDTKIALNITSRVDGCNKVVFPIDYFLSKKLKYAYHAHQLDVLGSLDPDFVKYQNFIKKSLENKHYKDELDCTELVSEYNRNKASNMLNKEITKFYLISDDIRHLRKHSKENEYKKGQIPLTMSDFLRIPEILSNPDELLLPQSNPKNGQGIAFIKTFADGKQYCILIDKYEDGELSPKTGYKKPLRGLNGFYSVHDRCPAKQSPNLTSVTPKVPRRFVAKITNFFVIPKQNHNYFSGLDGLTAEQWQNYLAQNEDWISLNIKYSEYHNNVITIQKPTTSFANYRGGEDGYIHYWFHCKKDEIDEKIKVIDKVFNIIIDEFPEWKTENPIISYRPRKDTYHEGYYSVIRELRFTKKENEKFLQVIPFFLKMLAITHEQIHFNAEYVKTLKYCKFQKVAEKVSELAIKEMDLLKLISLDERIRLNFSDAPEKVVKNLISNSWIIATQDEIRKHLQAINIKDVMWDLLANGNYTEETENYIITKGKDPKDKRMPKWVNIIYSYLCDIYGVKQRVE